MTILISIMAKRKQYDTSYLSENRFSPMYTTVPPRGPRVPHGELRVEALTVACSARVKTITETLLSWATVICFATSRSRLRSRIIFPYWSIRWLLTQETRFRSHRFSRPMSLLRVVLKLPHGTQTSQNNAPLTEEIIPTYTRKTLLRLL